ncbi:hypothetical protein D9M68_798360 [compost metagenome]
MHDVQHVAGRGADLPALAGGLADPLLVPALAARCAAGTLAHAAIAAAGAAARPCQVDVVAHFTDAEHRLGHLLDAVLGVAMPDGAGQRDDARADVDGDIRDIVIGVREPFAQVIANAGVGALVAPGHAARRCLRGPA